MPKYLIQTSFTAEGVKGVKKDGGSGRRRAVEEAARSVGGTLETFYFAFGETDAYVILDLPDAESVIALSLAVNSVGALTTKTTVLITPEQMDAATRKTVTFRPPGG